MSDNNTVRAEHPHIAALRCAAEDFMQNNTFKPGDLLTFKPTLDVRPHAYRGSPYIFVRYLQVDEMDNGPMQSAIRRDCIVMTRDADGDCVPGLLSSVLLRHWMESDMTLLTQHLNLMAEERARHGMDGDMMIYNPLAQPMN